MSTLYENIKGLCEAKGVSGAEMCRGIGSSKSLMTNLKLGKTRGITGETAQKIADYFGVTVDRVLGNETAEQKNKPSPDDGDRLSVDELLSLMNEQELLDVISKATKKLQDKNNS